MEMRFFAYFGEKAPLVLLSDVGKKLTDDHLKTQVNESLLLYDGDFSGIRFEEADGRVVADAGCRNTAFAEITISLT